MRDGWAVVGGRWAADGASGGWSHSCSAGLGLLSGALDALLGRRAAAGRGLTARGCLRAAQRQLGWTIGGPIEGLLSAWSTLTKTDASSSTALHGRSRASPQELTPHPSASQCAHCHTAARHNQQQQQRGSHAGVQLVCGHRPLCSASSSGPAPHQGSSAPGCECGRRRLQRTRALPGGSAAAASAAAAAACRPPPCITAAACRCLPPARSCLAPSPRRPPRRRPGSLSTRR